MSGRTLDVARFDLPDLLAGCAENLLATFDERSGLFPYSTRLVDGALVNDYHHPQAVRYTINSLLGLCEAGRAEAAGVTARQASELVETFLERALGRVETPADRGLLCLLLVDYLPERATLVGELLTRLLATLERGDTAGLNMQDLGWITWGASAASRHGVEPGGEVAERAFRLVCSEFVEPATGLPRHSTRRYRRGVVSFGSLVYFLRACHAYATAFADEEAGARFVRGVQRAIDLQGPLGEWPWMIDVRSGGTFDAYPVFSVHQDSMAMLFLLPAYDLGEPRTADAIERSLAWGFGSNELGIDFYPRHPFLAHRSVERGERAPRPRRYLRSLVYRVRPRPARFAQPGVRLNPESRSYHLGWILYAWAGRPEARVAARAEATLGNTGNDR